MPVIADVDQQKLYDEIMKGGYHTINQGGLMVAGNVEVLKQLLLLLQGNEDNENDDNSIRL